MSRSLELHEFLRSRRSVRQFAEGVIDPSVVERILKTATSAPSAHNRQPWRFAVVVHAAQKSRLAEAMAADFARDLDADGVPSKERDVAVEQSRHRITSAPVAIVLCMDMTGMDRYQDERRERAERSMAIQSVANAGTIVLLAVHAEGLGGVWICAPLFAQQAVVAALDLPASWEPQALLLIGKTADVSAARPRRELGEVTVYR